MIPAKTTSHSARGDTAQTGQFALPTHPPVKTPHASANKTNCNDAAARCRLYGVARGSQSAPQLSPMQATITRSALQAGRLHESCHLFILCLHQTDHPQR